MTDLDPRLVALYDDDNPDGVDSDFYRDLCASTGARSVLDLGCGTGALTVSFSEDGRSIFGVDPSATMIGHAKERPGAGAVTWIVGDSRALPDVIVDFAVMTGNVAQHIPDGDWQRTLGDLRRVLRPGGVLTFESRNPAAAAWRTWTSTEHTIRDTPSGPLEEWSDAREIRPGVVRLVSHNVFLDTDERLTSTDDLFFRDRTVVQHHLDVAGFHIAAVYGDWQQGPVTESSAVLVFVAVAR